MEKWISAFILAGGKSSRMGTEKGLVLFRGKALIEYPIEVIHGLGIVSRIIAHHPDYHRFGVPVLGDLIPGKGPMGGIYTALSYCETRYALILSCDSPMIRTETLKGLLDTEGDSVKVGHWKDRIFPFPGIYPKSILSEVKKSLDENKLCVQEFIRNQKHHLISLDQISSLPETEFANFNSPKDLFLSESPQ